MDIAAVLVMMGLSVGAVVLGVGVALIITLIVVSLIKGE